MSKWIDLPRAKSYTKGLIWAHQGVNAADLIINSASTNCRAVLSLRHNCQVWERKKEGKARAQKEENEEKAKDEKEIGGKDHTSYLLQPPQAMHVRCKFIQIKRKKLHILHCL